VNAGGENREPEKCKRVRKIQEVQGRKRRSAISNIPNSTQKYHVFQKKWHKSDTKIITRNCQMKTV